MSSMKRTTPLLIALLLSPCVGEAQIWNPFGKNKSKVEPASHQSPVTDASKLLKESGPWLIMATTFSGEGAQDQARDLAMELRQDHGLQAYVHHMTFDFTQGGETVGRGVDKFGAPIKMRYQSGAERREWAVLVGDFAAVDDSQAQKTLEVIKTLQPAALNPDEDGATSQNYAQIRRVQQAVLKRLGKEVSEGPMRTAFITRNPLLPEEYFVPKGVDNFVAKMNKGLDHSLLDAKGKYTVRVATFRGRGVLQGATTNKASGAKRKKSDDAPLAKAAENAHYLCEEMRKQGWDAYEFHDRQESYVAVGSFDSVTTAGGDPLPKVVEIIRTFGAAYDTPVTPLEKQRLPESSARAEQVKRTFNERFSSEVGQVATGLKPKYALVEVDGERAPRPVPFDVHPHVIETPKKTVSSGFAWRR